MRSARRIIERYAPLLVTLSVTVETALCFSHLPALRDAGPLGRLIARQAQSFAAEYRNAEVLAPSSPRLPAGFINFLHDPLACAVALGWREGVEIAEIPLVVEERDGWLVERVDPRGRPTRVVTRVDGPAFDQSWLRWVTGGANRANDANP